MESINKEEELRKNHERVDIISGKDNLEEINYEVVHNLKCKKFNNKVLGFVVALALVGSYALGSYNGMKRGYALGEKTSLEVSDLDKDDINYSIDTAPDIVILKYLDYAVGKDDSIKSLYDEANSNYSSFESDFQTRPLNKEDSQFYLKFRKDAKNISNIVPFGIFKYSLAIDENGQVIKDNTSSILIDNSNCEVLLPTKEKIDTNNLSKGSFIKDGILYVNYDNESSIYTK